MAVLGLLLGSHGTKRAFECGCRGEAQKILYGGRWWLPPSPSYGESCESKVVVACPSTKSAPEIVLTNLLVSLV